MMIRDSGLLFWATLYLNSIVHSFLLIRLIFVEKQQFGLHANRTALLKRSYTSTSRRWL